MEVSIRRPPSVSELTHLGSEDSIYLLNCFYFYDLLFATNTLKMRVRRFAVATLIEKVGQK